MVLKATRRHISAISKTLFLNIGRSRTRKQMRREPGELNGQALQETIAFKAPQLSAAASMPGKHVLAASKTANSRVSSFGAQLSIHQGPWPDARKGQVNLSGAFEKGQAYVAQSLATAMAGLQVIGFDARNVWAHEQVHRFYASLSRLEASRENEAT
jgi:hypothetical protein